MSADNPIIGGYGEVPVEIANRLAELLDDVPSLVHNFRNYAGGRTALFWQLLHTLDMAIITTNDYPLEHPICNDPPLVKK
jgi:hypothetical protein